MPCICHKGECTCVYKDFLIAKQQHTHTHTQMTWKRREETTMCRRKKVSEPETVFERLNTNATT